MHEIYQIPIRMHIVHIDNQIKTHESIVFDMEKCETEIRNLFTLTKRDTWISIFSKISLLSGSLAAGLYRARLSWLPALWLSSPEPAFL